MSKATLQVVPFESVIALLGASPPGAEETARRRCDHGLYETTALRRQAADAGFDISAWADWQVFLVHAAFTIDGAGAQHWVLTALKSWRCSTEQA